jgi:exodeoxyribonuclease VII large subunit
MATRVLEVGLLTSYIKEIFELDDVLADLWVEGEVSECFHARSGHFYYTLRDGESALKCVMFKGSVQRQIQLPRPGDKVAAHGRVSVYEREGAYQLYSDLIQPAGIGALALEFALLRQRLEAEGLFEPTRKRPIAVPARSIGVATSPDGAVWHDIQQIVARRYPLTELVLAGCSVQGDKAAESIVAALEALQADGRAEVIIVARGGGSTEDLACFNDERVVRAIFASKVPVVSAVGHEIDWTLSDEVADLRAPTPSAAAELCTPSRIDYEDRIEAYLAHLQLAGEELIGDRRDELQRLVGDLRRGAPINAIIAFRQRSSAHRIALSQSFRSCLNERSSSSIGRANRLAIAKTAMISRRATSLEVNLAALGALDPLKVLARGYSVLSRNGGRPISSISEVAQGEQLQTTLRDGTIASTVISRSETETRRS